MMIGISLRMIIDNSIDSMGMITNSMVTRIANMSMGVNITKMSLNLDKMSISINSTSMITGM